MIANSEQFIPPFEFTRIRDELIAKVSKDVHEYIPGFISLLNSTWDGILTVEKIAKYMFFDENQKIFSSLSDGEIIQIESFEYFFRVRRFRTCVVIGLASSERYIQITVFIVRLKGAKECCYVCEVLDPKESVNHSNQFSKTENRSSFKRYSDDEKRHLIEILKLKRQRLKQLERREAFLGLSVPPEISMEINNLRNEIAALGRNFKQILDQENRNWLVVKKVIRETRRYGTA